jgi:hypothetical protein
MSYTHIDKRLIKIEKAKKAGKISILVFYDREEFEEWEKKNPNKKYDLAIYADYGD